MILTGCLPQSEDTLFERPNEPAPAASPVPPHATPSPTPTEVAEEAPPAPPHLSASGAVELSADYAGISLQAGRSKYCYSTTDVLGHWVKDPAGRDFCCGLDAAVAAIRDQRSHDDNGFDLSCCSHAEFWDALGNCWVPVAPPHVPIIPVPGER